MQKPELFSKLDSLLSFDNEITNKKAGDMEDYLDYIYEVLAKQKVILLNNIDKDDVNLKVLSKQQNFL